MFHIINGGFHCYPNQENKVKPDNMCRLPTKFVLEAAGADRRGLVLRAVQVRASIPGQQGGAGTQHRHLGGGARRLSGFVLAGGRLGGLAERLLETAGNKWGGGNVRSHPSRVGAIGRSKNCLGL